MSGTFSVFSVKKNTHNIKVSVFENWDLRCVAESRRSFLGYKKKPHTFSGVHHLLSHEKRCSKHVLELSEQPCE